jgi:hypothetical protein
MVTLLLFDSAEVAFCLLQEITRVARISRGQGNLAGSLLHLSKIQCGQELGLAARRLRE